MDYYISEKLRIRVEEIMFETLGNAQQFHERETVKRVYDRIVYALRRETKRSNLVGAGKRHEGKSIEELREFLVYVQDTGYFRKGVSLIREAINETSRSPEYLGRDDASNYADLGMYRLQETLDEHDFDMNSD